jgi:hypothetical protein
MQRHEFPHNTPEQVEAYVIAALNLVNDLDPPQDLRASVFNQACALLASKQVVMQQPQPVDLGALRGNGPRF